MGTCINDHMRAPSNSPQNTCTHPPKTYTPRNSQLPPHKKYDAHTSPPPPPFYSLRRRPTSLPRYSSARITFSASSRMATIFSMASSSVAGFCRYVFPGMFRGSDFQAGISSHRHVPGIVAPAPARPADMRAIFAVPAALFTLQRPLQETRWPAGYTSQAHVD